MAREIAGKDMFLYIQKGGEYVLVGCATDSSINVSTATLSAACKSSGGWSESTPGQKSWTASLSGVYKIYEGSEIADNYSATELFDAIVAGTKIALRFGTPEEGDTQFAGEGYITSWDLTGSAEDFSTYSVEVTGSGPLTKYTVPTED